MTNVMNNKITTETVSVVNNILTTPSTINNDFTQSINQPSASISLETSTISSIYSNNGDDVDNDYSKTTLKMLNVNDLSSSLQLFGWVDYSVFILMLIVCAVIGIYFGFVEKSTKKNKRNVEKRRGSEALDYLVGGRKMKVFPVSLSLVASFVSGISLLGTSTEVYVYGTQYVFSLVTIIFSGFISWYIFLPVFCNLQLTSTYEYFEMRFDKRIRFFGSFLFTIGTILWLPIVIYVPALAFNQVTGINIHIITPIVCVVCIFYTCVGGLKAVVWTDVIQSFVMLGSIILVIIKGTIDVGGLGEVLRRNYEADRLEAPTLTFDPTTRFSIFSVLIGGTLYWTQAVACNQVMMQRFLAVPSLASARKALFIFVVGVIILLGCCSYNGLLIFATYHKCDPLSTKLAKAKDQLVPLLVMDILGIFPGLPGLFVAGVFSAALSSLSTGLNSLSAIFLEDFLKPYCKPLTEKQTAIFMRSVVVILGILCVGLVFVVEKLGMVLQLSMTLGSVTSGPLFGIFIMGVCFPWINGTSALFSGITSFCIMAWVCIKAQIAIATGELKFPVKPVSTTECTYSFSNHTQSTIFQHTEATIYHMSFLWYVTLGAILTILIGNFCCLIFGTMNLDDLDPCLFAPFIRKYIKPRQYLSVQPDIKEMETVIRAYEIKKDITEISLIK